MLTFTLQSLLFLGWWGAHQVKLESPPISEHRNHSNDISSITAMISSPEGRLLRKKRACTIDIHRYHKTGHVFSDKFSKILRHETGIHTHAVEDGKEESKPEKRATIHFIRDPAALVVSGYRYHSTYWNVGEPWLNVPLRTSAHSKKTWTPDTVWSRQYFIDAKSAPDRVEKEHKWILNYFHSALKAGKSLTEFYKQTPEDAGMIFEAYRAEPMILEMVKNYEQRFADPSVLHVRMEHFRTSTDFANTINCILKFIGHSCSKDLSHLGHAFDKLDLSRSSVKSYHATYDQSDQGYREKLAKTVPYLADVTQRLSRDALNVC